MYSLRNAFHHALKGGGRIDSIVTSLDYWKGCYEHAELTAVRDILRIPVGALSGPALDAQRLLGTHHDKLLKDPEAIAQLAYDSPHGCIFAKMASSQGHAPPSGGYLLSKPERWPMELRTIAAHSKGINAVAVDWNGILVASGSDDNTACVFDVSTGTRLMSFEGHKDEVTAVAFSPDASTLATASWDCSVILWSLISGKERLCIKGHKSGVTCLAFRNDGQALLTGSDDNSVQIWDPATG